MGQSVTKSCLERPKVEASAVLLGPSGSGKTSICLRLAEEAMVPKPTGVEEPLKDNHMGALRMNRWKFDIGANGVGTRFKVLDLGGKKEHQAVWSNSYANMRSIIYVFDPSTEASVDQAVAVFRSHVLPHIIAARIPLLLLANVKCDDAAPLPLSSVETAFSLEDSITWSFHTVSAISGHGLHEAITSLCEMTAASTNEHLRNGLHSGFFFDLRNFW